MRVSVPVVLLLLLAPSIRAQATGRANLLYEKARASYDKKDLRAASKSLDACLEIYPDHAQAHFLKAKIFYATRHYPKAFNEVLLAKSSHQATMALWQRLRGGGKSSIQHSGDSRPGYGNGQTSIQSAGPALDGVDLKNADRALAEYFFFHGNIFLRLSRDAEAAEQYAEALRLRPDYADAANNLASVHLLAGRTDEARAVIARGEAVGISFAPELKKCVEEARLEPAKE